MSEVHYLNLADYLLIAEAVLCRHLIKNHALPDGNRRVGLLCAVEFTERNGYQWTPPSDDEPDGVETVRVIEGVAAGEFDEQRLAEWVRARLAQN